MTRSLLFGWALSAAMSADSAGAATGRIGRHEVFETVFASQRNYSNPFADAAVSVLFTAPSGRKLTAYAFYDGDRNWRVRLAPDELGTWKYVTSASDTSDGGLHGRSGSFLCAKSTRKGFIRVDPVHRHRLAFADGTPFFALGDTCYGLVSGISDAQRAAYLRTRSEQRFNFVRFHAAGYPDVSHPSLPAEDTWPWGGTAAAPDYDRLSPRFFRRLEGIVNELRSRGMFAEVLVFNLYTKPFRDTAVWTGSRQAMWARYLVSRLAAFDAVFLWTVANEYDIYPDGKYSPATEADNEWALQMARLFRNADPHRHLITAHPMEMEGYTPALNGEIGKRFGRAPEIDVLSHQHNTYPAARWTGEFWEGGGDGLDGAIAGDWQFEKPVINTENGYEWLPGFPTSFTQQVHGTDKCRRSAWRIFAGGGAGLAAGFAGTWPGRDNWQWRNWKARRSEGPVPFTLKDMGLSRQLGYLYAFATERTAFERMAPAPDLINAPNLCLAEPGREYVVYAPAGGEIELNLSRGRGNYTVELLNPRTGVRQSLAGVSREPMFRYTLPDRDDWVLHVREGKVVRQ